MNQEIPKHIVSRPIKTDSSTDDKPKTTLFSSASAPPAPYKPPASPSPSPSSPAPKNRFLGILPFILGGLVLLTATFFAFSFFKQKSPISSQTELIYWGLWEPNAVLDSIISQYEEENPNIKITYRQNQPQDYRLRLQNKIQKAEPDAPDIFRIHHTWFPILSSAIAPVPETLVQKLDLDNSYHQTYQDLKINNQYFALPLMYDGLSLFYNQDLLAQAQITPPRTWWGLQEAAKKLTLKDQNGKITVAGAALGTTNNVDHWSDILGLMFLQNGANLTKPLNKNTEEVLTFYTNFVLKDKVWDQSLPSSTYAFAQGKLAFYFAPSWRAFDINYQNPDLNYATTTVPQLPQSADSSPEAAERGDVTLTNTHWSSYWVEAVNLNSKKQKEAWAFLEYLSSPETLERLYQAQSQIREFGEIYPRTNLAQKLETSPILASFVTAASQARSWYLASATHDDGLNDGMIKYFEDAVNGIINNHQSAADVLPTLEQGIQQLIKKYKL
jgi:ABC-type glycerol-3-phosphate transport system substrate-binding protein